MMTTDTTTATAAPPGFVSVEAKQKYTKGAIITAVASFLVPMLLPLLMIPLMFIMIATTPGFNSRHSTYNANFPISEAVYWHERVWFITSEGDSPTHQFTLKSAVPNDSAASAQVEATFTALDEPRLLATDKLWLISESYLAWYGDGQLHQSRLPGRRGDLSQPFRIGLNPAVLEATPDGINLLVIEDTVNSRRLPGATLPEGLAEIDRMRGVQTESGLWLVAKCGSTIFVRQETAQGEWEAVAKTDSYVEALALNDKLTIFCRQDDHLRGLRREGDTWVSCADIALEPGDRNIRVLPSDMDGSALLRSYKAFLLRQVDGRLLLTDITDVTDSTVAVAGTAGPHQDKAQRHEKPPLAVLIMMGVFFAFMFGMIVFIPIATMMVLDRLAKKYRVSTAEIAGQPIVYASMLRRSCAKLLDSTISFVPLMALIAGTVVFLMERHKADVTAVGPFGAGPLVVTTIMAIIMLYAILMTLVLAFLEGRYGYTPGKRLCGIRVLNLSLQPCGFWRAVLRQVVLFADAFFSYLVGLLCIGFTPHWQRLGDLAAGTIVVRVLPDSGAEECTLLPSGSGLS